MRQPKGRLRGQLTLRGIVIGCVGCTVLTATSAYTALKMGMLPWPIVFAAIVSLFFLKALGKTTLNEANVTHTVMSAGAMVAGGLAFTVPGIWMLGHADEVPWWHMLVVAMAGVVLGLLCTGLLRRHFMERTGLAFPLGQAAAQTLIAGDGGGRTGGRLFGAMGLAGAYAFLRDGLGALPALLFGNLGIPGIAFGIYNSPMLLAFGFLVGTSSVVVWFVGALLGSFGIIGGGTALGAWDVGTGQGIATSLGMGVMMGCGAGIIVKILLSGIRGARGAGRNEGFGGIGATSPQSPLRPLRSAQSLQPTQPARPAQGTGDAPRPCAEADGGRAHPGGGDGRRTRTGPLAALATLVMASVALLLCFALGLGPLPSIVVVALVWVTTAMASQSVGQSGIDPMEIFGLIVLLVVAAFAEVTTVQLFFVAAVVAVACGLAGDVMSDFKAGHVLGTDPRAQWIGQAIGGILGAGVAVAVMAALLHAYGPQAFGPQGSFVAAQASVVATMVSGIPSVPAFVTGLAVGFALHLLKAPAMMLGLGIYLPFYLSFSAFLGAMGKLVCDRVCKRRRAALPPDEAAARERTSSERGLVLASGIIGGESVVGVLIALVTVAAGMGAG